MSSPAEPQRPWWRTGRGLLTAAAYAVGTFVILQVTESCGWWG